MTRWLLLLFSLVRALFRSRAGLAVENLALRQQLALLAAKHPRPRCSRADRIFWVALRRVWAGWADALIIVKPETVVSWHRAGFRALWRWRSRAAGRPWIDREIRDLIRRIASDNPTWGGPRVHGELVRLGLDVSERTVARYLPRRPASPDAIRRWKAFLRNHRAGLAGMDFFSVPTVTFRVLYVLFIVRHDRRRIVHVAVTAHPTAAWISQQLRDAFPYDTAPRYLVFDRDGKFGRDVVATVRSLGSTPLRTAFRCPWQNGVAERWVGSARRELLDHVIVFGEDHLRRLLRDYLAYYHRDRCHLTLAKDTPAGRPVEPRPSPTAQVVALRRVGGLHHRYQWRDAA